MGNYSKTIAAGGASLIVLQLMNILGPLLAHYLPEFYATVWQAEGFKESLVGFLAALAVYWAPENTPAPVPEPVKPAA